MQEKIVYVFGELTNYVPDDSSRMVFNAEKGVYEKTLFLKQGYYNYSYVTLDAGKKPGNRFSFENTEGNFTNTENSYTGTGLFPSIWCKSRRTDRYCAVKYIGGTIDGGLLNYSKGSLYSASFYHSDCKYDKSILRFSDSYFNVS